MAILQQAVAELRFYHYKNHKTFSYSINFLQKNAEHQEHHAEKNCRVENFYLLVRKNQLHIGYNCSLKPEKVLLEPREIIQIKFKARRQKCINYAVIKQKISASKQHREDRRIFDIKIFVFGIKISAARRNTSHRH